MPPCSGFLHQFALFVVPLIYFVSLLFILSQLKYFIRSWPKVGQSIVWQFLEIPSAISPRLSLCMGVRRVLHSGEGGGCEWLTPCWWLCFPEAGSRHSPRHRWHGHGQPHGAAAQRGDDAAPHGPGQPRREDRGGLLCHHQGREGTAPHRLAPNLWENRHDVKCTFLILLTCSGQCC